MAKGRVLKAESDLKTAAHTMKLKDDCPTDTVCFRAQQCVEKYLKGFLPFKGTDFPKIRDIDELIALLPGRFRLKLTAEERRRLTTYATVTR